MPAELIGILGVIILVVLIACRMWIGVAMGLIGFIGLIILKDSSYALNIVGGAPYANLFSYTLTVVPMFTLMGMFISESKIGPQLYGATEAFVGHRRGGLASATVIACGVLGAITGGHYGATLIMSKLALPEMRKRNYDEQLAGACIASAAPLAIIIPPSVSLIFFGVLTETSISSLFMGGLVPGILLAICFCITVSIICRANPQMGPAGPKASWKTRGKTAVRLIPVIILILLVLGTVYTGICTTTESGAIGAMGALIIALFMKDVNWKMLKNCFLETAKNAGMILFLLSGTYIFITFMSVSKLPFFISNFIMSIDVPFAVLMILIALMYFFLGMFLPEIPMMLLTVPLIWPALNEMGTNPVWFGVIVIMMMALGSITPPVGVVVFILSGASKIPVMKLFKGCLPFIVTELVVIVILCIFPQIVTWLPSTMG
ncbi:MAG: TRAP transporter large permease [Eubacterium sp.]|jgi:TRAP transporter, DctM subunit|nr:TRAP transporter large permease [Eubacterium sp.]